VAARDKIYLFTTGSLAEGGSETFSQTLPGFEDEEFVKQMAFHPTEQSILVTTSTQRLFEVTSNSAALISSKCRSAIYNEAGSFTIALLNEDNEEQDHLFIFKGDQLVSSIKLDFAETVTRNEFRAYSISEYHKGTVLILGSFFPCDDDKDAFIGKPIIFSITSDLTADTTLDHLKSSNSIQYYFDSECA